MTKDHQRHAAQCRHARAAGAKNSYYRDLSVSFLAYRPTAAHIPRLADFASYQRRIAPQLAQRLGFKTSTLLTWLREWEPSSCVHC